ncbi:hypothetical protein AAG570_013122 [Ranatra chinensis]|uniref:Uncharacterized protein n=1 Tax=Ranatra chinensis TaxID=642074 RepID=A0ABD0Z447_9HEMI
MSIISDLDKFNRGLATFDFIKRKRKFLSIFEAELDDSVSLDFRLTLETFRVESVDLSDNRLICAFATRYVTLHDMTPVYEEPYLYPQVGQTMCPVASTSVQIGNECVRWRSYDCGLFSVTGNFPTLNVYDTEKQSLIGCVGATKAHIVDLRTGNNLQATCGNFGCMVSIAWSPSNENLFFTASSCGEIVAWDSRVFRKSLARSTLYPPRNVFMTPELQFDDYGEYVVTDRQRAISDRTATIPDQQ